MHRRIPVGVVTGIRGSGKTALLDRLLSGEPAGRTAVIARADGSAPAGAWLRLAGSSAIPSGAACQCCSLRGELADALRDLFMAALRKRIPAPERVLIETAGTADPAAILYSLHYEPFLRERYVYQACVTVVNASAGAQGLGRLAVAVRQIALADALVLAGTRLCDAAGRDAVASYLSALNPQAARYDADAPPGLEQLLAGAGQYTAAPAGACTLWSGARGGRLRAATSAHVLRLAGRCELSRAQFLRAMDELQDTCGTHLLRVSGVLHLRGEAGPCGLHGVHRQLYWLAAPQASGLRDAESILTFILDTGAAQAFGQRAQALLTGLRACAG